ncbi:DUF2244 domain-containing protein [Magnetovibrio sp. PR-2]|uniref:DUF2244 domain-containing protein n=1 Tax=Magnetovibrio sp. PR-2 TaxID=3120356 RepID=UPI002FCDF4B8
MQSIDKTEHTQTSEGLKAFVLTLRPRRSADPRVAYTFCGFLGVVWFAAGVFLTTLGGWPVLGFFGAEFIFIAAMVHVFIKRTEVFETIEITSENVRVSQRDLSGVRHHDFPAYWVQVNYTGSSTENGELEVRSHGEAIEIGKFLSAHEKQRMAEQLNTLIFQQHTPLNTN